MSSAPRGVLCGANLAQARPAVRPSSGGSTDTTRLRPGTNCDPATTPMAVTTPTLSPAFPEHSRLNERGVLEIGGCSALELAREFGTPAYVVAEDDLRARARSFREAFAAHSPDTHVSFASKAFPCTAILGILAEEGLGVDVASGGELALALRAGFDPSRVIVHGNAKSHDEPRLAVEARVGLIVLDSLDEIARLEEVVGDRRQAVL